MTYLEVFVFLQLMDFLTTLVGLRLGLSEASPAIRIFMTCGSVTGLVLSKLIGFGLAAIALSTGRHRLLNWINYWFAALVIWNCVAILTALRPLAG